MAAPFVIPSIYTAVDKVTAVARRMTASVFNFGMQSSSSIARADRAVNKFIPGLNEGARQMLNFARSAAIFAAVFATINFSTTQVMAYEDAMNSFRTIVSDLADNEFTAYQQKVNEVAKDTRRSSVMVASSFETIAGLNADFAKTADGLGIVSKASITLSKAAKMELQPASESLVGSMNQFQMAADQADRAINVLAAGQAVGAASITQASESLKNFGSTAYAANLSFEQTNALIQVMGKFSLFGAEAGTKLRGSVLKLQQSGAGYASGQFVLSDALEEVRKKMDKLRTAKQKDAYLNKVFGAENISTGRILLNNIDTYKQFTAAVTGTQEAYKAAEINSNSLSNRITELKAKWVTMITGTQEAGEALGVASSIIVFVTDHMETLTGIVLGSVGAWVAWKAIVWGARAATFAYNIALGISTALQGKSAFYTMGSTVAYKAYRASIVIATAAQWAWNAAMSVGLLPIIAIVAGIALLIAIIYSVVQRIKGWGEQWDEITRWMGAVWDVFQNGLILAWRILENHFMSMVDAIVLAWKWGQNMIGNISDEQFAREKAQIAENARLRIQGIKDAAHEVAKSVIAASRLPEWKLGWKTAMDIKADEYAANKVPFPARVFKDDPAPRLSTQATQNQIVQQQHTTTTNREKLEIEIKDQTGTAQVRGSQGAPPVKLTPTIGAFGYKG